MSNLFSPTRRIIFSGDCPEKIFCRRVFLFFVEEHKGVQRERLPLGEHTTLQEQAPLGEWVKCSVLHFCFEKVLTLPPHMWYNRGSVKPVRRRAERKECSGMSYAICRIQKCGSSHDIAGIQIHDRRERTHSNSNPDIDFSKSHLNYSLCDNSNGSSFNAYIDKQIAKRYTGKKAIRKDAVRMVSAIFTSDNDFFDRLTVEQQREYFQSCYEWAVKRWGAENIISSEVHMDEATPHMHLEFVPLTADGRLSAKECIGSGSKALQQLQDDFYKAVGIPFGLERGNRADLTNGEKPRRHQRVAEYKENTKFYEREKNTLQATLQALQAQKQAYTDILHAAPENVIEGIPVPSMAKIAIGKENKDKLLYSPSDIEHLQELAKACAVTAAANDRRSSELDQQAERQEHISAELSEREHLITIKEQQAEYARSSAECKLKEAEEKQAFYETSDPMIQQLQQRVNGLIAENNGLIRDLRQERKTKDSLTEHNTALKEQLSDQQEQIQPLQQQNGELSERVRVLEEELQERKKQLQELEQKHKTIESLYDTACECGEYVCDKVGLDFDRILDMRLDGYRLSYIFDEGRGMSR